MLEIRKSSISEFEGSPTFAGLIEEYAAESAIKERPHPAAKMPLYAQLERAGALQAIGAFLDTQLIGFITVLAPVLPHYGAVVAVAESYFVAKEHRATGAGLKLLVAGKERAREVGSPGILFSAPIGGALAELLVRKGSKEVGRVFFEAVEHA